MNNSDGSKRTKFGLPQSWVSNLRLKLETSSAVNSSSKDRQFDGPKLNPVPVPELAALDSEAFWDFLRYVDPIDSGDMLAFQVAQLTIGMTDLKRRIEELEDERSE